jgi:hypothetical protein
MQQGRVQLDADWNEAQAIGAFLDETTRVDTIGPRGVPKVGGGFAIGIAPGGTDLTISCGRLYVDGLLCELDGSEVAATSLAEALVGVERLSIDDRPLAVGQWIEVRDPAGAAAPQLVRIASIDDDDRLLSIDPHLTVLDIPGAVVRRVASYTAQPDLPDPEHTTPATTTTPTAVDLADGTWFAYLDAWLRPITVLEDPALLEPALNGLDTTTRSQTVAQVRLKHLGESLITDCGTIPQLPDLFAGSQAPGDRPPSTGRLGARSSPVPEQTDLCEIPADARYQGLENQLYRVQIHDPGELGTATFTWSRENASIGVLWTGQTANRLAVSSLGRDAVLGFASNQLVELFDDTLELHGRPGTLVTLAAPPADGELTIDPSASVQRSAFPGNPRVRRWDNPTATAIRVEVGPADGYLALENGVEVRFEPGWYNTGDYWLIPARTATRDVDWPRDGLGRSLSRPPDGIRHHYAPLALVEVAGGVATLVHDCRDPFPSLTTITADDVAFDNQSCELRGARTVQDALDALCESSTLRRHKKYLHGWGIVCGLRVTCGPDGQEDGEGDEAQRRSVTVGTGYAIDCEGNDVLVERDEVIDVFRQMRLDEVPDDALNDGTGDLSLYMVNDPEAGPRFRIEPYDPDWNRWPNPLAATIWFDVYQDCIRPIHEFLKQQLGQDGDANDSRHRVNERKSVLASLLAQVVNPAASQTIYLSRREHELMLRFYRELRELLQSETFCAMFDDATPFPEYPDAMPEMDTIFAAGHHQRIRLRPGGSEAWTVGGGINPVNPSSDLHRFDLRERVLVERLSPISGASIDEAKADSGAGPITDVAFSPDGQRIYVIAPTRNGDNTLFRAGRIRERGVDWGDLITICDVQLVSLATSDADPGHVYAIGSRKGLYRIDPDVVDPSMPPTLAFAASGHLVITSAGRGYATAIDEGASDPAPRYDRVVGFTTENPSAVTLDTSVPAGSDDLAVAPPAQVGRTPRPRATDTIYVVTGTGGSGPRQVVALDALSGEVRGEAIDVGGGPIRLVPFPPTGVLMVVSEDDCSVSIIDVAQHELIDDLEIPVHVGPVSGAASVEPPFGYTLDYWSDTITVLPAEVLRRDYRFPLEALAEYRRQIILAFRDLLSGFLQYLKDCFCDHLMVACPVCLGDERIYLGSVAIRNGQVYKVCNFSRRRYVKSFPTIDYWLSIVPIMPVVQRLVEEFCCLVLPDLFTSYRPREYQPEAPRTEPRYRYSTARTNVELVQRTNFNAAISDMRTRVGLAGRLVTEAGRRMLTGEPVDPALRVTNLLGRPTDQVDARFAAHKIGVVRGPISPPHDLPTLLGDLVDLFRTPRPGDDVILHDDGGRITSLTVARGADRGTGGAEIRALRRAVTARDSEVAALRSEVERLRAESKPRAAPADRKRIADLETEVAQLRGLRDQVDRLLAEQKPAGSPGRSSRTAPTSARAPVKATPTRRPRRTPPTTTS